MFEAFLDELLRDKLVDDAALQRELLKKDNLTFRTANDFITTASYKSFI